MNYCRKCLMPDTRPGISFTNEICSACINYDKQKKTVWEIRRQELEALCDKYRNNDDYDCAIAVSGGKDSHYQVYVMKELMGMNPVLLTVKNIGWTETGEKNLNNLSDTFGCDIISLSPNIQEVRERTRKDFIELGSPNRYIDSLIYSFPPKMTRQLGLKLLVYGENVSYTYGGGQNYETPSANLQPLNDVVRDWAGVIEKDIESIYLSYYVPWDSHHNYEVAKRWGFRHLGHEYVREGTIEQYNQIDSIPYLLNQYMKYVKFRHASATEMASRWIRAGLKTREEMIPYVKEHDGVLDQGIVDEFCSFTNLSPREFWEVMDKWYNTELFEQDMDGVWHEKFEVGSGDMR